MVLKTTAPTTAGQLVLKSTQPRIPLRVSTFSEEATIIHAHEIHSAFAELIGSVLDAITTLS